MRELLLEQLIRLLQRFSVIGNAGIDHGTVNNKIEEMRFVAKIGQLDALQLLLKLRELGK